MCATIKKITDGPPSSAVEWTGQGLTHREQQIANRLVLELYCMNKTNLGFVMKMGPEVFFMPCHVSY
jgi:hypothetical protein